MMAMIRCHESQPVLLVGHIPGDVRVLSLDNNSDVVVPHLDAVDNPDTANRATVTFDVPGQEHAAGVAHGLGSSYLPAAESLGASSNDSVQAFTQSAGAFRRSDPGTAVTTQRYQASRTPTEGSW